MNDVPRQKLREILTQYGRSICENPQHCKGLLLDLCGEQKREINILIAVLEEHAVADLMHSSASVPTEMLLARLTERLCDNRSMEKEAARWGVESWALALGMNIGKTSRTPQAKTAVPAKTAPEKPPDKVEEEKPASKTSRTPRAKTAVPAKTPQEKSPDKVDEDKLRSFAAGLRSFDAELRQHNQEELRRVVEAQSQPTINPIKVEKNLPVSPPSTPTQNPPQSSSGGQVTTASSATPPTPSSDYWEKQFGWIILATILGLLLSTAVFVWLANQFYTIPQGFFSSYDEADALVPKGEVNPGGINLALIMYFILPCLVGIIPVIFSKRWEGKDDYVGFGGLGCVSGLLFPFLILIGLWGASSGLWGALLHIQSNNWSVLLFSFGFFSCIAATIFSVIKHWIIKSTKKS